MMISLIGHRFLIRNSELLLCFTLKGARLLVRHLFYARLKGFYVVVSLLLLLMLLLRVP